MPSTRPDRQADLATCAHAPALLTASLALVALLVLAPAAPAQEAQATVAFEGAPDEPLEAVPGGEPAVVDAALAYRLGNTTCSPGTTVEVAPQPTNGTDAATEIAPSPGTVQFQVAGAHGPGSPC
jgi:hypothetical protein